ncbi:MAG: HAD family hydrolase [Proteobacteria bacterium]|nr:HAD family hydrolase [Pseudomonadota bacterium]
MTKNAILFDLDNTLTHRKKSIARFSERFISKYGDRLFQTNLSKVVSVIIEADNGGYLPRNAQFNSIKDTVSYALSTRLVWSDPPSQAELRAFWMEFMPKSSIPMDGVPKILSKLKDLSYLVGIVSNGAQSSRVSVVNALEIENTIDILVSSGEVGVKKPDSGIFEHALEQLGVKPSMAWFVGDHPINDIIGSQNAGLKPIWLSGFHDWPGDYRSPRYAIRSLTEILGIVLS